MSRAEIALALAIEMMRKSGVREWEQDGSEGPTIRQKISEAAVEMAAFIWFNTEGYMALPDNILVQTGTAIVFADTTDHAPGATAANNLGARTAQIDLTSVADGAARQSDKVDLGATRAEVYEVKAAFEIAATPTAGDVIALYWAPSNSGTAGQDNPANVTGADAAYAGYSANMAASLLQLQFIGDFVCTAQATGTVQVAQVSASFRPAGRYGSLVVRNESGAALHSDAVEMSVRLLPLAGVVTD